MSKSEDASEGFLLDGPLIEEDGVHSGQPDVFLDEELDEEGAELEPRRIPLGGDLDPAAKQRRIVCNI